MDWMQDLVPSTGTRMCSKDIEDNWNIYKNKYEELIEVFVFHKLVKAGQRKKNMDRIQICTKGQI